VERVSLLYRFSLRRIVIGYWLLVIGYWLFVFSAYTISLDKQQNVYLPN